MGCFKGFWLHPLSLRPFQPGFGLFIKLAEAARLWMLWIVWYRTVWLAGRPCALTIQAQEAALEAKRQQILDRSLWAGGAGVPGSGVGGVRAGSGVGIVGLMEP